MSGDFMLLDKMIVVIIGVIIFGIVALVLNQITLASAALGGLIGLLVPSQGAIDGLRQTE